MNSSSINLMEVNTKLPVFWCVLSEHKDALILAVKGIQELIATHPDSTESNVRSIYMSPWKSHKLTPHFGPLIAIVEDVAEKVSITHLKADLRKLNFKLTVTDCWGAIYGPTDKTLRHHHYPADLSAVIYLDAEEDCAPLVLGDGLAVKPVPGLLILFPGILSHYVPESKSKRVCVAMNLQKIPVFSAS